MKVISWSEDSLMRLSWTCSFPGSAARTLQALQFRWASQTFSASCLCELEGSYWGGADASVRSTEVNVEWLTNNRVFSLAFPCIDPQVQVRVIHSCSDPPETFSKEDSSRNFWGWGTGQDVSLNVERRQRSSPPLLDSASLSLTFPDFLWPGTDPLASLDNEAAHLASQMSSFTFWGLFHATEIMFSLILSFFLYHGSCRTFNITSEGCCVCSE